jgi:hypothetical protein
LAGTRAQSRDRCGSGTLHAGQVLGEVCHCFPPPSDVPTFAARCLYVRNDARDPSSERRDCGRERCPVVLPKFRLPRKFSVSPLPYIKHSSHGSQLLFETRFGLVNCALRPALRGQPSFLRNGQAFLIILYPGVNRPRRKANHPPPSNTDDNESLKLYLRSKSKFLSVL